MFILRQENFKSQVKEMTYTDRKTAPSKFFVYMVKTLPTQKLKEVYLPRNLNINSIYLKFFHLIFEGNNKFLQT